MSQPEVSAAVWQDDEPVTSLLREGSPPWAFLNKDRVLEMGAIGYSDIVTYTALCMTNAAQATQVLAAGFIMKRATGDPTEQGAIAAGIPLGMLIGGCVSGAASESIGRARVLRWALTILLLASVLEGMAPNLQILIVLLVLIGISVGASTPPLFALATELAPFGRSGPAIILVDSFWMNGSIVAAVLAFLFLDSVASAPASFGPHEAWRPFALACAIVPAISTALMWKVNLSGIHSTSTGTVAQQVPSDEEPAQESLCGLIAVLVQPSMRAALLPLMLVWFCLNFGAYGISTWITVLLADLGTSSPYLGALLYGIANAPGNIIGILAIDTCGRRPLLIAAMSLAALSALALARGAAGFGSQMLILAAACTFSGSSQACYNALNVLSAESFAVQKRVTAFGILTNSGRIASLVAQFVNAALIHHEVLLLCVTSGVMALGCVCAIFLKQEQQQEQEGRFSSLRV
eukprot:gnl/TRDRNA2_/TRDRNA2_205848_c0_seq1.p1 gnl/TRDRNA2_/TRDRNA2_205848_c0~~gnl/TRDRNA2_/TRDRNA2_205848_c0_seq1.p1  ORF type:complete len:463 (+),score=55.33 gnl/TRDRNA2_/TRDRNA2_205848_c0_seq1:32-1420(+)